MLVLEGRLIFLVCCPDGKRRWELLKEGLAEVSTLIAFAILLDAVSQLLILQAI